MRANKTISVEVKEYERFLEECKKRDISASATIRKLIKQKLKEWEAKSDADA